MQKSNILLVVVAAIGFGGGGGLAATGCNDDSALPRGEPVGWTPAAERLGLHPIELSATEPRGANAYQAYDLRVVQDFCPIYPIALPQTALAGLAPGAMVTELARGTGPGNYSWLTWTGASDAPTLAASLLPPGASDTYTNLDDAADHVLNIGDFAQGAPGSMNAAAVRERLDALTTQDIILPVWDLTRGQGSQFDYRVLRFVTVRLRDYRLTGNGWITFEYKGEAICYNVAPEALPQTLTTPEDTPLPITLTGSDADGDALTFTVLDAPAHGTLSGSAPDLIYTPNPNFTGDDQLSFRVSDGMLDSAPATITITVTPVNDAPQADDQTLTTPEDTPLPITLSGSDIDGDALGYTVLDAPVHGTLDGSAPDLIYTPDPDFTGVDQLTFQVDDGALGSAAAMVTIVVTPVNDAPVAYPQQLETEQDTALPITLAGDDVDGDAISFVVTQLPAHGTLSGSAPALIYTPTVGYHGEDRFAFATNDGALSSSPAFVDIVVWRHNHAPDIVSPPVTVATEAALYRYDVDAVDPDNDPLVYAFDRAPDALGIAPASGLIEGTLDPAFVQPVRTFNSQCFVVPDDTSPDDGGAIIAPVFQRVRRAITRGSGYVAPQTLTWHQNNRCLGCHVQNQTLLGLQGSMERAQVDEAAAEYLLSEILASQQSDGSIRRSHPEFSRTQTAFALWALSYVPDRARTLGARERGLRFFQTRVSNSGVRSFWNHDHNSGWLSSPEAITALVSLTTGRYLRDIARLPGVTPAQVQLGLEMRALLPRVAEYFLSLSATGSDNLLLSLAMVGLAELAPHLDDAALTTRVNARIAALDTTLRARERPSGGWHRFTGATADPLTSAWVGFALDMRNPPLTDPVVLRNIEFLLATQRADGTWLTNSGLFTTHLGTTGLVMAYLPVALEHLGNPDLTVGHLRMEAQGNQLTLSAEAINRGLADANVSSTLRFRLGRDGSGALLGEAAAPVLRSGETRWVSITLAQAPGDDVVAEIVPSAPIEECLTTNNASRAALARVRATDPRGLFDTQSFLINLEDANAAPLITSEPVTVLKQGGVYDHVVAVSDPDIGDAHEFALTAAPNGLFLNPITGRFSYDNTVLRVGTYPVTVRVTDLRGAWAEQRFTLAVTPNSAPQITSTPVLTVYVGETYHYDVDATDPDDDVLSYRLDGAPLTMAIDSESGEIVWIPAALHLGDQPVAVIADDGRGGTARQAFVIRVEEPPPNHAPEIISTPATSTFPDHLYTYVVAAIDPDGDVLSMLLPIKPAGMTLDELTGQISWTPTAAQVGRHPVRVEVGDGRGGGAIQEFEILVREVIGNNRPPEIISTPSTSASPDRLYTYLFHAIDPDGDALSRLLPIKPAGMTLDELTGQITWTPTAAQLGRHPVRVEVVDGRGGIAIQTFEIVVSQIIGNQPPAMVSLPSFVGKVGREYRYALVALDPNGDTLTYSLTNAPPGMSVDATGLITWTPAAAGSFAVRARASDGQAYVEQAWSVHVVPSDQALNANVLVTPNPVQPGGTITVLVSIEGAAGQTTVTATLDGQPIALDPDGITTITAPSSFGAHQLVVTVTDGIETDTTAVDLRVVDPNDQTDPVVQIHAPREGAADDLLVVTSPQQVIGSVNDDNLYRWDLMLIERGAPASEVIPLASGTGAVSNAPVGTLDPTLRLNGQYRLVLRGEDESGNVAEDSVAVAIEGDMKLGHFSITFEDLNVPVAGVPVRVTRTYDTRQRHRNLDFGYGWTVDYQNVRVHESRRPGFAWELNVYPSGPLGLIPNWCVESALGNVVSVTMPDGEVEKFRARAVPECNQGIAILDVDLAFEPMENTKGRLVVLDDNSGRLINGSLADAGDPGRPLDPSNYRYIDAEGIEYTLDQSFGLREIRERAGDDIITFGHDGIVHSNGLSVDFVRDAADRITQVIAPDGAMLSYEYDNAGNLSAFVDAEGNRTTYTYQSGHYLRDIIDPRGVRALRNEYDEDGRLVAVIDADGNRVEYSHDIAGQVEQVRDRNGGVTIYVYNDRGDVLAETNPLGQTITRTYDSNGNKLSETDALGNTQSWTYDALGNVITETNAAGEITRHEFGPFNQVQRTRDPAGVVTLSTFYRNVTAGGVPVFPGPLVSTTDANGAGTVFGYDPDTGELTSVTDASGAITRTEYDENGFRIAEVDALGHRTEYVNDESGRVLEERRTRTRADGTIQMLVTRHTYDANGNLFATEHPDGSLTTTTYDANDRPVESCDGLGRCTVTAYDAHGNVASITYPDGSTEAKTYDAHGNVLSETDRAGRTTRNVYDAAHRLLEMIHPDDTADPSDNPRVRNVYDAAGRLSQRIDENGHTTTYGYDAAGRETHVTDALGHVTITTYDQRGRRIAITDAAGRTTRFGYDAVGRVIETVFPDPGGEDSDPANNPRTRTEYDGLGRKIAEVDEAGRITRYVYDAMSRLTAVVLPNPATGANPPLVNGVSPDAGTLITRYAYDEQGNKVSQTDAEGRVTRWEYDAMGRETARILPLGQRETTEYDEAGERVAHTDFNGITTRFAYDVAGRVISIDYPNDADVAFTYTATGQRRTVTDGQGVMHYTYDARDRLIQIEYPDGRAIEYAYDAAGNKVGLTTAEQAQVFGYDALNRLVRIEELDGANPAAITEYDYDAVGNRASMTYPNGTRTDYGYDARNRLRTLTHRAASGLLLLGLSYQVDATGQRTAIEEADGLGLARITSYAYDGVKRLTGEFVVARDVAHDRSTDWTYDRVGNRLIQVVTTATDSVSTLYVYDANDRLGEETTLGGADAGTTTYTYDANGSTTRRSGRGGVIDYVYNDAQRLEQSIGATTIASYAYTVDGIRIRQEQQTGASTASTDYLVDSNQAYPQVIEEWTAQDFASPVLAVAYTFGDDLISQHRGADVRYYHVDGLGSTRLLTDANETITDRYVYEAFGELDAAASSTSSDNLYRYTGEQFDPNLGFYYLRARYYDSSAGRFTSRDAWQGRFKEPISLHKYIYANASPAMFHDPSGNLGLLALGGGGSFNASLQTTSAVSYVSITARLGARLLLAVGTAAIGNSILTNAAAQDRARNELKNDIFRKALAIGVASTQILYHYTQDIASAKSIVSDHSIIASEGFNHRDGVYRPEGAYATPLAPFVGGGMTQRQLARSLFDTPGKGWVQFFVAFVKEPIWRPIAGNVEYYRPAPAGSPVPIIPLMYGVNLMPP